MAKQIKNTKTRRSIKKRPLLNFCRRTIRFCGRVHWPSIVLRSAALAALVAVEAAVACIIQSIVPDPLSRAIMVTLAALAGAGVALGPSVAISLRSKGRRFLAWIVVAVCVAVSAWNLSTTLGNAQAQSVAQAARQSPSFHSDEASLIHWNAMVDGLADEYGTELQIAISERDRVQARIDAANPKPVLVAGFPFWVKAILFHGIVAGFSAGFAVPLASKKRAKKTGRRGRVLGHDDNVTVLQF